MNSRSCRALKRTTKSKIQSYACQELYMSWACEGKRMWPRSGGRGAESRRQSQVDLLRTTSVLPVSSDHYNFSSHRFYTVLFADYDAYIYQWTILYVPLFYSGLCESTNSISVPVNLFWRRDGTKCLISFCPLVLILCAPLDTCIWHFNASWKFLCLPRYAYPLSRGCVVVDSGN